MKQNEIEKQKQHIIIEIIEYVPNAILSRTIIKKSSGNVVATSFDEGEEMIEKITPSDIYVQIIAGEAELEINDKKFHLKLGEGIVIAAKSKYFFYAKEQFKMITSTIKSDI